MDEAWEEMAGELGDLLGRRILTAGSDEDRAAIVDNVQALLELVMDDPEMGLTSEQRRHAQRMIEQRIQHLRLMVATPPTPN